jgi:opine dehydrogenase
VDVWLRAIWFHGLNNWKPLQEKAVVPYSKMPTVVILGAGSGGVFLLADLARVGCVPRLCDIDATRFVDIQAQGGLEVEGQGLARIAFATTDVAEAVKDADILIVCTGGAGQEAAARSMAPHLKDGQILLLIQGNTGGSLVVRRALDGAGCTARVDIAEMDNYPSSCWRKSPGSIAPIVTKRFLQIAAFPGDRTADVFARLSPLFPTAVPAPSIIATGFTNMNAVLHVANCVANAAAIDRGGNYKFYAEGVTPLVAALYRGISRECIAIGAVLGVSIPTLEKWFELAYGITGSSIDDICRKLTFNVDGPYQATPSPKSFAHKYVAEDTPCGLIPMAAIGAACGVPTPAISSVIGVVRIMTDDAVGSDARTIEQMGLAGMDTASIRAVVNHGFK